MKSASARLGLPCSRAICWRSVCSVAIGNLRALSPKTRMSSSDAVGRPEADHGARGQPFLVHDLLQHLLGVVEQVGRGLAHLVVRQNRGKRSGQLPGLEERRPVDVARSAPSGRNSSEHPRAQEFRRRRDLAEIRLGAVGARLGQAEPARRRCAGWHGCGRWPHTRCALPPHRPRHCPCSTGWRPRPPRGWHR